MNMVYTSNNFLATSSGGSFWGLAMSASFTCFTGCALLVVLRSKLGAWIKSRAANYASNMCTNTNHLMSELLLHQDNLATLITVYQIKLCPNMMLK